MIGILLSHLLLFFFCNSDSVRSGKRERLGEAGGEAEGRAAEEERQCRPPGHEGQSAGGETVITVYM